MILTVYVFIPPQNGVLGGVYCFQYVRHSVTPSFCPHLNILLCDLSSSCPTLFKLSPHLNHQTLHVLSENIGGRVSIARVMPLCNFNCKMFTIVQIVHTLC